MASDYDILLASKQEHIAERAAKGLSTGGGEVIDPNVVVRGGEAVYIASPAETFESRYGYDPSPYTGGSGRQVEGYSPVTGEISVPAQVSGPTATPVSTTEVLPMNGYVSYDGASGLGTTIPTTSVSASPVGWGILAWVAAGWFIKLGSRLFMKVGVAKSFIARYGAPALKALVGGASFAIIIDAIMGGLDDNTSIEIKRRKAKRYSIGTNPRLNTLLKVGKRVDNIFVRYDSRIRKFRSRLRGYSQRRYYRPPSNYYLSAAERKQLRG
jgi:hypothetical protein